MSNKISSEIAQTFKIRKGTIKFMKIDRIWAMPNKWTFTIKPIRELLQSEVSGIWVDPFSGENGKLYAKFTNDLAYGGIDALTYLKNLKGQYDGVLYDPPYSITQAKQCYDGHGMELLNTKPTSMQYWADCKNEIARLIKPGGKAICFGWSSMGLGKNRGFEMTRILLVPHGGSKNDTICTVETKIGVSSNKQSSQTNMTLFEGKKYVK
jgi:hypothetical protein